MQIKKGDKFICHIGSNTNHINCILNKKFDLNRIEIDEESNKDKFFDWLSYYCDECDLNFCLNCASIKNLYIKPLIHEHALELIDNSYDNSYGDLGYKCISVITIYVRKIYLNSLSMLNTTNSIN